MQPPRDADAFAGCLARYDDLANHGFVVESEGQLASANLTNVVLGAFRSGHLGDCDFSGHERRGLM
ncbi:hypothetical protein ACG02S_18415 [Roseateles sp. DC23W]|uniref:Uncharacterized protein n=1 Tax=Pelomonas dachongensis TaxID=3299029 RepID=A0ABW7EQU6_9BURK